MGNTTVSNCRMIDAVMYGMMPSAKIVRREVPPENRSKNPKNEPAFCSADSSNRSASTPGVGDVTAQAVDRQQRRA